MINKAWMKLPRPSLGYVKGVESFVAFAFKKLAETDEVPCPCEKCINNKQQPRHVVRHHCIRYGFMDSYTTWVFHGETTSSNVSDNCDQIHFEDNDINLDSMPEMFNDIYMAQEEGADVEQTKYDKYLADANHPLFPGCKTDSKLSFIVWLYNLKCDGKWPDWSFDSLLQKLKEVLPEGENLPPNFYETKKMVGDLGFRYEKIDACRNDCMLYWKEDSKLSSCKTCSSPRWKTVRANSENGDEPLSNQSKVAIKQLRYLPLIPRLKKLFMSSKTAEDMKWHHIKRHKDGVLRHPADSRAWKHFDSIHPTFSNDCRNVRLGLSTDGMNPFNHGSSHSLWPVTVVVYNLPSWKCMKQHHMIMPLLIPGPTSPGNDIDVYLRPHIEELKTLWTYGVQTYDASKGELFKMRAALLWTISDFPALAALKGWVTKGKLACPVCLSDTCSLRLRGKECYMGHRRFLEADHKYRSDTRRFDGKVDYREPPTLLSGFDEFEQVEGINVTFGKTTKHTVPHDSTNNWRKKSIFFELPYWKTLLIRHNLDLMHIEKNICDNLMKTLLGMAGSKDTLKARQDLQDLNIRQELHPKAIGLTGSKYELPPASFSLTKKEKQNFLEVLKNVKVPDGYASNIARCVNVKECKLSGLKSHDCHILMHQLLPIAIRGTPWPEHVKKSIIDLCHFFKELWSNDYREEDFEMLNKKIPIILSNLEIIFPPAFFVIMVHLSVHLAEEAKVAGNVKPRNMYSFERYMFKLKGYIRNRSHPEGSIVEGVVGQECLTFCSRYLRDVDPIWNRLGRNEDENEQDISAFSVFSQNGRFLGTPKNDYLDLEYKAMAHSYVLFNCDEVQEYISVWEGWYRGKLPRRKRKPTPREIDNAKKKDFPDWFKSYVVNMSLPAEIKALARGPNNVGRRGSGFLINGFRFHTESREQKSRTQNSGVYVAATTRGYSSTKDSNPVEGEVEYFGIIQNVIELEYDGDRIVVLFDCKWYDSIARNRGVKTDEYGYTLVNANKFLATNEPFVLASQVEQVFYVDDPRDKEWRVVVRTKPRDLCQNAEGDFNDDDMAPSAHNNVGAVENELEDMTWVRYDIDAEVVDLHPSQSGNKRRKEARSQHQSKKRASNANVIHEEEENEEEAVEEDSTGDEDLDIETDEDENASKEDEDDDE